MKKRRASESILDYSTLKKARSQLLPSINYFIPKIKHDNLTGSRIHYVYSNKLNVLGCTIPKAGSSTLQRFSEAVIFGKLTHCSNVSATPIGQIGLEMG